MIAGSGAGFAFSGATRDLGWNTHRIAQSCAERPQNSPTAGSNGLRGY